MKYAYYDERSYDSIWGSITCELVPLDLQFFAGEKTEKATPKKRQDARKKGQVAKSQDVNMAIGIISHFFLLILCIHGSLIEQITIYFETFVSRVYVDGI